MHKTSLARKKVLTLLERSSLCPPICYHVIFLGTPTAAFNNHKELSAVWRQNTCTSICCFGPSRGATLPSASCFTSSPSPDLHPAALITSLHVNKLNISWVNGSWRRCFCKHFFFSLGITARLSRLSTCCFLHLRGWSSWQMNTDASEAVIKKEWLNARDRSRANEVCNHMFHHLIGHDISTHFTKQ